MGTRRETVGTITHEKESYIWKDRDLPNNGNDRGRIQISKKANMGKDRRKIGISQKG